MRKALTLFALVAVVALVAVGCSSDSTSSPVDPDPGEDLTPPASPSSLWAQANGSRVALTWRQNSESDLGGYMIYRMVDSNVWEAASASVDSRFVDTIDEEGLHIARYRVSAVDRSGNESAYSVTVEVLIDNSVPDINDAKQELMGY